MLAEGATPRDIADALAQAKARKVASKNPGRLVLGSDQILDLDGEVKRVRFIRADQNADLGTAISHSISKAQQIIDEQGKALLKKNQL